MRARVAAAVALCAVFAGCGRVRALFEPAQRSYVDVPTALDAVRARQAQGDQVFVRQGSGAWAALGAPARPDAPHAGGAHAGVDTLARGAVVLTERCLGGKLFQRPSPQQRLVSPSIRGVDGIPPMRSDRENPSATEPTLPQVHPFALDRGPTAYARAHDAMLRALDQTVRDGGVRREA